MTQGMRKNLTDLLPAALGGIGLILLYYYVPRVFRILVLSMIFALLFEPVVESVRGKLHLSGTKSTALVYGLIAVTSISLLALAIPVILVSLSDITDQLEHVRHRVEALSPGWYARLNGEEFFQNVGERLVFFTERLGSLCIQAAEVLVIVVAALVLSFYIIKDKGKFSRFVLALFPFTWRPHLRAAAGRAKTVWERFVGGQFLIALIVGILETAGLILLGVPYPYLFGLIGGFSNLIPYVGPFLGAVPAVLAVLFEGGSLYRILGTVFVFVAVQQLDNWFLTPRIMKGRLGLHPAVTVFAVLTGAELFGFLGATLAVPVVGILWAVKP